MPVPPDLSPTHYPAACSVVQTIHIGSPQEEPKVAAILSVVESCRRMRISVATNWRRHFPDLVIARSAVFQPLLPLRGLHSIGRPKRRGSSVKVVLRQQPHSFLFADHPAGNPARD